MNRSIVLISTLMLMLAFISSASAASNSTGILGKAGSSLCTSLANTGVFPITTTTIVLIWVAIGAIVMMVEALGQLSKSKKPGDSGEMEVNETLSKMTGKFIFTGAIIFILMVGSLFLWVAILGC